jgi:hypothetical protein
MEIPNPKLQNPNKLQYPIPKFMKRLFHGLILCHVAVEVIGD